MGSDESSSEALRSATSLATHHNIRGSHQIPGDLYSSSINTYNSSSTKYTPPGTWCYFLFPQNVYFTCMVVITLRSRDICTLTAQKSKSTRHFLEIIPWYFAHVLSVPLPALNDIFLVFFSLEMWDPLRSKYIKIYKNRNVWRNVFYFQSWTVRQRNSKHVRKNRVYLK